MKQWTAKYLPFGGVQTSYGSPTELRFPGQWFQSETGLYQNWMRDYDPTTGRYIQSDPLGLVDGASVYGYARQSPGMYADPRGEAIALLFPVLIELYILYLAIDWCMDPPDLSGPFLPEWWPSWNETRGGGGDNRNTGPSHNGPPGPNWFQPGGPGWDAFLAALAAAGATVHANNSGAQYIKFEVADANGPITMSGNVSMNNGNLTIDNFSINGSGPGSSSIPELRNIAQQIGQQMGATNVTVNGFRVSGANPGRPVTFSFAVP